MSATPTPHHPQRAIRPSGRETAPSLPELLAPAGSFDAAIAAFTYGADAVYLGLSRFSARADAANFSDDDLRRIIAYARHLPRPRKVYVTLNTLLETHEREALLPSLALLEEVAVDGVIVQDLGLATLLRRHFPAVPLHASTQLACTSLAGARALKNLGFVRIVTARELTLREAAEIGRGADVEIEVFVHGALCYSLSGLCLFSSLTTGRSGNRGRCAYCCRQPFTETGAGRPSHPFSMRDLALADAGDLLRSLPLASLKIEGRMKSPLYVAAVTDLYRHVLDGDCNAAILERKADDLRTIFSRPWTHLYARSLNTPPEAIIDRLCVGHRGTPVGIVLRVTRDLDGLRWLAFDATRPIERHDGLQIDLPGRPLGFAVDRLREARTKRPAVALPAGSRVEVALPREAGDLPRGATICHAAAQAVRRAFPVPKPREADLRLLRPADLTLTLAPDALTLEGCGHTLRVPATLTPANAPTRSRAAAERLLARLGDEGFVLRSFTFRDPQGLFLPASLLNAARRNWAAAVRARLATETEQRAHVRLEPAKNTTREPAHSANVGGFSEVFRPQGNPSAIPAASSRGRQFAPQSANTRENPHLCDARNEAGGARFHSAIQTLGHPATLKVSVLQRTALLGGSLDDLAGVVVALTSESTWEATAPWREAVPRDCLRFALPVALRDADLGPMAALVGALADRGFRRFECADLTSWQLLRDLQPACDAFDVTADWTWYATNPEAIALQHACGLTGAVTGPEANLPNLLTLPETPPREVLVAQFAPLFIAYTRPLAESNRLTDRNGARLRVTRIGRLWVTFDKRPWSAQAHLPELLAHGFNRLRLDLSWAGADLPLTHWRDILTPHATLPDHFGTPRL